LQRRVAEEFAPQIGPLQRAERVATESVGGLRERSAKLRTAERQCCERGERLAKTASVQA